MLRTAVAAVTLFAAGSALAQGIEGAAERYRFEPGDRVLYETKLARCPVGELLPGWSVEAGAYECARFRDRIWIRPLEQGTVLYLRFSEALPEEFSLEFPVWFAEDGCPLVEFRLHSAARMRQFGSNPNAHIGSAFLAENQLLRGAGRLHSIPGVIVHGRHDVVCPVEQAFALHEVWPEAELVVVPDAGHAASEPGIAAALVAATDRLAERLS